MTWFMMGLVVVISVIRLYQDTPAASPEIAD